MVVMEISQAISIPKRSRRGDVSLGVSMSPESDLNHKSSLAPNTANNRQTTRHARSSRHLSKEGLAECGSMIKKLLEEQAPLDQLVRERRALKTRRLLLEPSFVYPKAQSPSFKQYFTVGAAVW